MTQSGLKKLDALTHGTQNFLAKKHLLHYQTDINLVAFFYKEYKAHRILWKIKYGYDPVGIDHINGNRIDNRLINLREADQLENMKNVCIQKSNTSGFVGVSWNKAKNAWDARIECNKKIYRLGRFKNKEDAIRARKDAEVKHGFHPNHGKERTEII